MSTNTAIKSAVEIESLRTEERRLREVKSQLKAAQERAIWEAKTKARNPQYQEGSVRKPTPEDIEELGHTHGLVCSIVCSSCGSTRTVNLQDAFQARFCKECKKAAGASAAKDRRASKKLAGASVQDLMAQIAAAEAALQALKIKSA